MTYSYCYISVNAFSHLLVCPQGKEDFERQQKELLEKENIIKQSQVQLGQEQVRLFTVTHAELVAWVILYNSVLLVINIYTFSSDTDSC